MSVDEKFQKKIYESAIEECKKNNVVIPTFKMLENPSLIPQKIKDELKNIGINDINPLNLFRITWYNEKVEKGGLYSEIPNFIEIPSQITGIKSKIFMLCGKYFPTGSHKVGAAFGPLITRLISGKFDPKVHEALWPSTGNYCRGGAFNCAITKCKSVAVIPEDMSKERFDWLNSIGAKILKTPGGDANIKGLFDACKKMVKESDGKVMTMNQFVDFSNPIWHYWCTSKAIEKVFSVVAKPGQRLAGVHMTQGSAGTIAGTSEYLKKNYPTIKIAAGEALQCSTLLDNGYGSHRIEGIGDRHIPWVLNIKNLDLIVALDDEEIISVMHLFNQPAGRAFLREKGVPEDFLKNIGLLGKSGIANLLGCIKEAKLYDFNENDILITVLTDSMDLYQSRLKELKREYTRDDAIATFAKCLEGANIANCLELTHQSRRRCHNLKYFTWIEQQGKSTEELNAQWYDDNYWGDRLSEEIVKKYDSLIMEFNKNTGLAEKYGM